MGHVRVILQTCYSLAYRKLRREMLSFNPPELLWDWDDWWTFYSDAENNPPPYLETWDFCDVCVAVKPCPGICMCKKCGEAGCDGPSFCECLHCL